MSVWCLEGVWKESGGCLESYWKLSGSAWNSIKFNLLSSLTWDFTVIKMKTFTWNSSVALLSPTCSQIFSYKNSDASPKLCFFFTKRLSGIWGGGSKVKVSLSWFLGSQFSPNHPKNLIQNIPKTQIWIVNQFKICLFKNINFIIYIRFGGGGITPHRS